MNVFVLKNVRLWKEEITSNEPFGETKSLRWYLRIGLLIFSITLLVTVLITVKLLSFPLPSGLTPNGTLLLTMECNQSAIWMTVLNMHSFKEIANITLPKNTYTYYIGVNPDGLYAYVGTYGYNLTVISLNNLSIV